MSTVEPTLYQCATCAGCGQVATDDDRTPWVYWAELRPPANLALVLGLVRPLRCEDCRGSGRRAAAPRP